MSDLATDEPLLVDAKRAAKLLAVSERTLWNLTARGELQAIFIGRAKRYAVSAIKRWIDRKGGNDGQHQQ